MTADDRAAKADRVLDAFHDLATHQPELARDLLGRVLDSIRDMHKRLTRDLVLSALLVLLFELLNRNLIGEASAVGVKVSKLGELKYLIPIAVGFLLFRVAALLIERNISWDAYTAYCNTAYPQVKNSHLINFIVPFGYVVSTGPVPEPFSGGWPKAYRMFLTFAEVFLLAIAVPIGFITYAVVQLFRQGEPPHIAAIVVAVVSGALLLAAYVNFFSAVGSSAAIDEALRRRGAAPLSGAE